jgi:hypothetical protein
MITKEQYKKALEEYRILVSGTKYTRNGWTGFRVFEIRENKLIEINLDCSYKSKKDWGYSCSAWGTNRILEIILAIGYKLGLEFNEIKQNWAWVSER